MSINTSRVKTVDVTSPVVISDGDKHPTRISLADCVSLASLPLLIVLRILGQTGVKGYKNTKAEESRLPPHP